MEAIIMSSLLHGAILSAVLSVLIVVSLRVNAEMWVHDYPPDIKASYGTISARSERQKRVLGVVFFAALLGIILLAILRSGQLAGSAPSFWQLALTVFIVVMAFNLVDLLLLDWLLFAAAQPSFLVLPGTEGMAGYKDYGFHFRGFLIGTGLSLAASVVIGGLAFAAFRLFG